LGSDVVVMLGAGLTVTVDDADFVVSAAEVAFTDTVKLEETDDGALYVAADAVVFVRVPQAAPLHPVPETLQVTPLLLESLLTVAVKLTVCPTSMLAGPAGARETEIAGGVDDPPPQPHIRPRTEKMRMSFFIVRLPPEPFLEWYLALLLAP
jgi:hypothetical protein